MDSSNKKTTGRSPFKKVLVANRGEIAVRVIQSVQQRGMIAVAIYSEPDANAMHVQLADEAYALGGLTSADSYLKVDTILELCQIHDVDAVHPGYGFLSENADFAKACEAAGVTFIGPSAEAMVAMGDKIRSKAVMEQAGVPVVPGYISDETTSEETFLTESEKIGYPVLVKASAGGGGKGMRLVRQADELIEGIASARREAQNSFGDPRIFLEKYIEQPRHIEFQIFGDTHGHRVHLFERECSIQRRHQKIIEETPSVALTSELRNAMGEASLKAANAIEYTNAGTVEFILAPDGSFYFLEVNTRLQVEHPVTERVTQTDLVSVQLDVAMGKPLPWTQADLSQHGHAIECRVYAEDPSNNFLPSIGPMLLHQAPSGPNIRVDTGIQTGDEVSIYYDPMLAKLIVWGADRDAAIERMQWALSRYIILGVITNLPFLSAVLAHPVFQSGEIHTHFLDEQVIEATPTETQVDGLMALAGLSQVAPDAIGLRRSHRQEANQSMTNTRRVLAMALAADFRVGGV